MKRIKIEDSISKNVANAILSKIITSIYSTITPSLKSRGIKSASQIKFATKNSNLYPPPRRDIVIRWYIAQFRPKNIPGASLSGEKLAAPRTTLAD